MSKTKSKAGIAMGATVVAVILAISAMAYLTTAIPGVTADNDSYFPAHCTTTVAGENVADNAVQTAIDGASPSNNVICVAGGTYPEQLSITVPLTLLGLGTTANPTTIQPTAVAANAVDPSNPNDFASGTAEAAIVLVQGTTGVAIDNLAVDGSVSSASIDNGCSAPSYEGVVFLGASGTLTNSVVTNLYQATPSLYGCQSNAGLAVVVQTASPGTSKVTISNDVVSNYQKNGISCNDVGSTCSIYGNTVSPLAGATSSSGDATNGIQVAFGAVATVSDNTVTGNECNVSSCGPDVVTQYQAAGILTYGSGAGTVVRGNTVVGNDVGVLTYDDTALTSNNQIQNNRYEGLFVSDGVYSPVGNDISCDHSASCAVAIGVASDGYSTSPTTVSITNSNFDGRFGTALVQIVAYTGSPYGGSNSEPVNLTVNGLAETVTAGASSSPSFVNLTDLPGGPFPQ